MYVLKTLVQDEKNKTHEELKYWEKRYRKAKDSNDKFGMHSFHRHINRCQAKEEALGWILSIGVGDD